MIKKKSIQDTDVKILTLLFCRLEDEKNTNGLGVHLLQKFINQSSNRNKISHNLLMEHLYELQRRGFIEYDDYHFWMLSRKGIDTCEYLEDSIGDNFYSLKRKIYN